MASCAADNVLSIGHRTDSSNALRVAFGSQPVKFLRLLPQLGEVRTVGQCSHNRLPFITWGSRA
jgi:hypothetical protein